MREKENPPRKKEEFSTLSITITFDDPDVIIAPAAQKPATLKFAKPLVKKIEGPFNEQGKLVEEMIEGQEYIFKATEFQKSTMSPIKHIWWAEKIDDGEITDLEYNKGVNPYLDDKKVVCFKYKAKKAEKNRIYAYVASPAEKVSVEVPVVSFPFIIARSARRAGECKGTNGEVLTREDITQLNINYPKEKNILKQKLETGYLEIEKPDLTKPDELNEYIKKRDSRVQYALEQIKEYNKYTDDELFNIARDDMDDWAQGDLEDNLYKMLEFFKNKNRDKDIYEDKRLTTAIAEHSRTKDFIDGFTPLLKRDINEYGPDLKVTDTKSQFIESEYNDNDYPETADPKILGILGLQKLSSLTYKDKLGGLGISVDGTQAYDISLTEFSISNGEYRGTFLLEIFDHFGLDSPDLLKDYIRKNEEFTCWFMLQHLRGYKPFITYIPLHYKFTGSINDDNFTVEYYENN